MNEQGLHAFLSFGVGEQSYAVAIRRVVEVAAMVSVERLPHAPAYFLGVANRHGTPLPILDMSALLLGNSRTPHADDLFIVVQAGSASTELLGLWVDEVRQVRYLDEDYFRPLRGASPYVQSIVSDGDELFQLVALEALLAVLKSPQEADVA